MPAALEEEAEPVCLAMGRAAPTRAACRPHLRRPRAWRRSLLFAHADRLVGRRRLPPHAAAARSRSSRSEDCRPRKNFFNGAHFSIRLGARCAARPLVSRRLAAPAMARWPILAAGHPAVGWQTSNVRSAVTARSSVRLLPPVVRPGPMSAAEPPGHMPFGEQGSRLRAGRGGRLPGAAPDSRATFGLRPPPCCVLCRRRAPRRGRATIRGRRRLVRQRRLPRARAALEAFSRGTAGATARPSPRGHPSAAAPRHGAAAMLLASDGGERDGGDAVDVQRGHAQPPPL